MSGGSLNYFYSHLQEHIGDFGDKELDDLVKDLADLFHDREWYLSSDTCEGDWLESRDNFKKKWFTENGRQERIEKYLDEIRSDVLDMFGMDTRKCDTCKHWEPESDKYGRCEHEEYHMMHRAERCAKWEAKDGKNL